MISKIKFSRNIESEISEQLSESIKSHIYKNIETKIDSYVNSIWKNKADAEVMFETRVEKISDTNYEIKMHLNMDGKLYNFKKDSSNHEDIYKLIDDLFKTIKSELSDHHHK